MSDNVSRVQRDSKVPVVNLPNALTVLRLNKSADASHIREEPRLDAAAFLCHLAFGHGPISAANRH